MQHEFDIWTLFKSLPTSNYEQKKAAPEISEPTKPLRLDNDYDIFFTWIHGEYAFLGIFAGSNL